MRRGLVLAAGAAVAAAGAALLRPASAPPATVASATPAAGGARVADASRGASVFGVCSACHTVGRGGADVDGPNLYGVVGSRVAGRRPRYGYTQALRDAGGAWTADRLSAWLTDPAAFAPGTAMHFAGLPDARDRADVIAFLATQGPPPK